MIDLCSLVVSDGFVPKIDIVSDELLGDRFLGELPVGECLEELFGVGILNVGVENSSVVVGEKSIKFGIGIASLLLTVGSRVLNPVFWLLFSCNK